MLRSSRRVWMPIEPVGPVKIYVYRVLAGALALIFS